MSQFTRRMAIGMAALGAGLAFAGSAAAGGEFAATGSTTTPRTHQGSALLPDGRVLQYGGLANIGVLLSSAEIYDPATGAFTATGSAADARMRPNTIGLPDGRVLVTGGRGGVQGGTIFASAEIYDPATGTFSPTGAMTTARYVASAVRLNNGKVLVAGGFNFTDGTLGSAELYDPVTGTFTATGSLAVARDVNSQAALLPDGRVLIAGGYNDDGPLASAEVYDPALGTFSPTGSLAQPRGDHVLVALPDGRVLVVAGFGPSDYAVQAEIWDPATGVFSATGSLSHPRANPTATVLADGRVLVAGGSTTGKGDINEATAEIYDPATGLFADAGDMVTPRSHGRANRLADGSVLFAGGWAGEEDLPTANAELFVPVLDDTIFVDGFELPTR